ncbi:hypothetical protein Q8A67_025616 [Cirrhinus molitorella]|uniref:Uncharacterized protein n=1 Tax=Cirrhinus molitorella TaxID=172907 RepID=A0AA88P0W7_9TELE|nr:hypothetical protein Q8A67_025616 [Cirrhinus molitorella]
MRTKTTQDTYVPMQKSFGFNTSCFDQGSRALIRHFGLASDSCLYGMWDGSAVLLLFLDAASGTAVFPPALTKAEGDFGGCCPGANPQGWGVERGP